MEEHFDPESRIMIRETIKGKIWTVRPVRVVEDTQDLIVLYMTPGTVYKHPRTLDGDEVPRHLLVEDWKLVDKTWYGGGALYLGKTNEPYMIIGFRRDDNSKFERWYINLQDPLTRTKLGFDYLDMELDIEINSDLTEWHWKDEDKFIELIQKGKISNEKAENLRSIGQQVAEQIINNQSVVNYWKNWNPKSDWTIPEIPEGWNILNGSK